MATIHTSVPNNLLPLLESHLPNSLPLLRRLQFTRFPAGQRPTARIILAPTPASLPQSPSPPLHFAAAYLDFGSGIETSLFMYSTLEDNSGRGSGGGGDGGSAVTMSEVDRATCESQILAILDAARHVSTEQPENRAYPGACLVGTLATVVREVIVARGGEVGGGGVRLKPRADFEYEKWLFRVEEIPPAPFEIQVPEGATWESANESDCELVISRTHIPRQVKTLLSFPNLVLKLKDGTPIAWAFLGTDASLSSLHCEEPYRKKGYAKALAAKLLTRSTSDYGPDGWASADVAPDNLGSRRMCASLGGKHAWDCSWNIIELEDA